MFARLGMMTQWGGKRSLRTATSTAVKACKLIVDRRLNKTLINICHEHRRKTDVSSKVLGAANHCSLAALIANLIAVLLDPCCRVHERKALRKQFDDLLVESVNPRPDFSHC